MAFTFPIDFPTSFGLSDFNIGMDHAVGVTTSIFTFSEQVQEHQGEAWDISGTLNLLNREQAEDYNAFILKLKGRKGTFTMTVPGSETPRGVATGTPLVNGADQTGDELITDGWTVSTTGILKTGDFFQLGSGSTATLHKVLEDVDSDGSGNATIKFAGKIITAPADNAAITTSSAKGHFRLKGNLQPINIKPPNQHSLTFQAREVK